jgi:TIR domain
VELHYFHSDSKGGKSPGRMTHNKKLVSTIEEQQGSISKAIILTTEGIGCEAVRTHLNNLHEEIHRGSLYECGTFHAYQQTWDVSIIEIGEGGSTASFEVERAINYYHPDIVLCISIAHGLHDVRSGDVVSATKVYAYEALSTLQVAVWDVSHTIQQQAYEEAERSSWQQRIKDHRAENSPSVVFAPIVSSEQEMMPTGFEKLHARYQDSVALEIGEYGVAQAARAHQGVGVLVVCGIAGKQGDDEEKQKIAAHHASAFAFEVLARLEGKRPTETETTHASEPREALEVFYSYIDKDEELVEKLRQQLVMLERTKVISGWYAGKIGAGKEVNEHLHHLETARLILLLISPDYIASEQHYMIEVKHAMERYKAGDAKVVPILLRSTSGLQATSFGHLRTIPKNGKPVSLSGDLDRAFKELADEIAEIVKSLRNAG